MSRTWRKWFVAALAVAVGVTLISGPAVAKKPVKPPSDGGRVPPGTIFFGMGGDLFGMSGDGSNKYVASPVTSPPSHFTYGADNHRWILGALHFEDSHPDGDPHWELAMLRPDPSFPDGGQWIQVADLQDTETDPFNVVEIFCGTVGDDKWPLKNPYALWARDDSFVSFLGVDWRNLTQGIFRVPISALEVEVLREATPVCGLDDLETVVSLPLWNTSQYLMGFAWSPEGDKVAFPVHDESTSSWSLYVRTVDGSQPDLLVWSGEDYYSYGGLDWSPDGTKIAFGIGVKLIVTVDPTVENQQPTVVVETYGGMPYCNPVWSPDSQYIAISIRYYRGNFMSLPPQYYIGRVSANGGHVKKLTRDLDSWTMKQVYRWTP